MICTGSQNSKKNISDLKCKILGMHKAVSDLILDKPVPDRTAPYTAGIMSLNFPADHVAS